jgi:hypothetical protein
MRRFFVELYPPHHLKHRLRAITYWLCIKSRADALANLPSRARWFPQGDAAIRQRNGSYDRQPSSVKPLEGIFMSDIASGLPHDETPFVDPWSNEPNHQGVVPVDALFIGAWDNEVGIFDINEALFLVRDDRQDLLWSLTTHSEKTTRENLDARESGDPAWIKSEITRGCVAGAPREGTQSKAATQLLDALVRVRVHHQFPRPPYLPGLLTIAELADIVRAVTEDLERNALAAEIAQRGHEAPIIKLASELGLNPRPAGHNDSAWMADCPHRSHTIMLSPSLNEFGCGYCRRKGGPAELRVFVDHVKSSQRDV